MRVKRVRERVHERVRGKCFNKYIFVNVSRSVSFQFTHLIGSKYDDIKDPCFSRGFLILMGKENRKSSGVDKVQESIAINYNYYKSLKLYLKLLPLLNLSYLSKDNENLK